MRPFTIDIDPANVDADGLADANDSTGTSVTLDGALTSGGTFTSADGLGRQICIIDASTVDQSGATFTITGTDADGRTLVEAVTGPGSGATVESTGYFKTVTSIAIASPAVACTVDVGTVDEVCTPTYPLDVYSSEPLAVVAKVTGTCAFDIEVTNSDVQGTSAPVFANDANWTNKSADLAAALSATGYRGMRAVFNSYTNTAEVQLYCSQPVGA